MKMAKKLGMMAWLLGIGAVLIILVLWLVVSYNGLIRLQADVDEAWANVETQYQRRADLIPNLVEVAKGSAAFQQETFTEVTELRSQWQSASATGDRAQQVAVGEQMGSALARLLVTVEQYPNLNTEAFNNLQAQIEGTENRVAVSRTRYNAAVKVYNVRIRRIPTVFIAGLLGFEKEELFEADEGAEDAPEVDFG
jgi:LemA protein